jgi:hypothetical protein
MMAGDVSIKSPNEEFMNKIIKIITICSSTALIGCTGNSNNELLNNNIPAVTQHRLQSTRLNNMQSALQDSENLSWHVIGNARFSEGGTDNGKVVAAPDGSLYVAFADYTQHNKLSVMHYDEANMKWTKFGSTTISVADANDVSMIVAPNSNLYIAFTDSGKNNKAAVMTYDKASSSWKTVGVDAISSGKAAFTNIIVDANSNPYLAYSDLENGGKTKVVTYEKSSNTWKPVGDFATKATSEFNSMAFAPDGTLYLVCSMYDFNMGRALVKSYDKSTQQWNMVGDIALSNGIAQYTSIAISPNGVPYITFADQGNDGKAKVMAYDKSVNHWRVVGNAGISVGSSQYNNIATTPDGKVEIVFKDAGSSNKATALYFDNISHSWKPLSSNLALISEGEANHISLTLNKDGLPYVAYSDNSTKSKQITVTGYTPPSWHYVGQKDIPGSAVAKMLAVAPDNTPYIVFNDTSNGNKVTVMSYNTNMNQWEYVGSKGISPGNGVFPNITIGVDGTVYIAFDDVTNNYKTTVMSYNKSSNQWSIVGQRYITTNVANFSDIKATKDGSLYIAINTYFEINRGQTAPGVQIFYYDKNNNNWVSKGFLQSEELNRTDGVLTDTTDGMLYLAYKSYTGTSVLYSYDKYIDHWNFITGGLKNNLSIQAGHDGKLYMGYVDWNAAVMSYTKANNQWDYVGSKDFTDGDNHFISLAISSKNQPYITYQDSDRNYQLQVAVMFYDSIKNTWGHLGQRMIDPRPASYTNLAISTNDIPYLSFQTNKNDGAGNQISVMAYY